jgi:RNA polymerase primary sigma factor
MIEKKVRKSAARAKNLDSGENSFRMYLKEINRFPLLSKEDEEKTAKLAATGDKAARDRLVNSNLRFVISIAKKYQGQGLLLEDLISEGNLGLLYAAKQFDIEKGYRFITYAVWWIRQSIIKAIHEKGRMIRLPVNKTNELIKIKKTRQLIQNESEAKQDEEIRNTAMFLEMAPNKAVDLFQISQDVLSLEGSSPKHQNNMSIIDFVEDDCYKSPFEQATNTMLRKELETALDGIENRAAEVIRCRYGLGGSVLMTLKEIGARYNLSRERVRQIEKRGLLLLQHSYNSSNLENYIA